MTKSNEYILPKEKPFETVYELKNEIPSFEEFMKTYESDGKVNYDDLIGVKVDEVKGYGPCSDNRCYSSNSNACKRDSNGRIIEFFYELYTPCPAARCPDKQDRNKRTHWVHDNAGCGRSNDLISDKLRIRCPDCFNTSHMKYHKFTCSAHKDRHWWTSSMSFSKAFAIVYNNSGLPTDVYLKIVAELRDGEQWDANEDSE